MLATPVFAINLLVLRCRQLEVSRAFYTALGCQFVPERHGAGPLHYACQLGSLTFELYPAGDRNTSDVRLGFQVENLSAVLRKLPQLEGKIVRESVSLAVVADPDGHLLELTAET